MATTKERNDGMVTSEYVLTKYPQLQTNLNWDKRTIGWLLSAKVIQGNRTSKNVTLINEKSVKRLIDFINDNLESQKIIVTT